MSETHWVDRPEQLDAVIDALAAEEAYAIDTEFLRERTYYPKLALVQIAWRDGIALIDPLAVDLHPLADLLRSDRIAVFHAADQDLEVLDSACGDIPRQIFDTQIAAGFVGFSTPSLSTLVERMLSVRLSKGDRLTDWMQRPLTSAQRTYAAADVAHLLKIRTMLSDQLAASGRIGWVEEECELLRVRARGQGAAERAWWKLKDGRVLRGRDRLVAQNLCAWRERKAQQLDRPVRFVVPDLAVITIAQGKPSNVGALGALRGIDGRYTKGPIAQEILEIVETAVEAPMSQLQLPESDDFDKKLRPALTLVSAWIAQLARDALIDTSLLATRSDLVSFLRGDTNSRLAQGWREDAVGAGVRQLVSGDAALAFLPGGSLVLERRSNDPLEMTLAVPTADWVDAPMITDNNDDAA